MTEREINIRSVLFLVVGILLLLSLVICIYIVNGEKDLIKTEADVVDVKKDSDGTGKNEVTLVYSVNGTSYEYNFYYKDNISVDDKLTIYYHKENATSVQTFKTSKIIFVCPVLGLVLCSLGLYELFKKNKNGDEVSLHYDSDINTAELEKVFSDVHEQVNDLHKEPEIQVTSKVSKVNNNEEVEEVPVEPIKKVKLEDDKEIVQDDETVKISTDLPLVRENIKEEKETNVSEIHNMNEEYTYEQDVTDKVTESISKNIVSEASEEEIKNVIREVIKEVMQEVKEEVVTPKEVVQQRVIPNYFYISGTSLIYEESGKKAKEINLKDIKKVVRTINSAGNVVKLVVSNDEIKCVLTNMKNIDLEQLANLLHNKMRTIDETFKEIIERKEY